MTTTTTYAKRFRDEIIKRLRRGRDDEGVALLSAILFMVILAGLSVVLVSTVLAQMAPTALAQKRTSTIYAAQAGVQATLSIFRTASAAPDYTNTVYGNPQGLPCSISQTNSDGQSDGLSYQVSISYYSADPAGQSAAWLAGTTNPSYLIACSPTAGLSSSPKYAMVVSKGAGTTALGVPTASLGNRSISAIYKFKVTNINIAGGRIWDQNHLYCLQAPTPATGNTPTFVAASSCVAANNATQLWIYDTDYKLKLSSSVTSTSPGVCITGPFPPNTATQNAVLQPCLGSADPARWNQLWSWGVSGYTWRGQNQVISTGQSTWCLTTNYAVGANIELKPLMVSTSSCSGTFAPEPAIGAGAASYNTHQLVNYKEFGRCADVTSEDITSPAQILYPCKQDPTGTGVNLLWNHHWYYSEPLSYTTGDPTKTNTWTGQIYVNTSNVNVPQYCLQTPMTGSAPFFPVFKLCNGSPEQQWTRTYDTTTNNYSITDTKGRCMQADKTQLFSSLYSEIDVVGCNGSDEQKWNAPAAQTKSDVSGYKEVG